MVYAKIMGYKGEVLLQDVVDVLRALDENIDRNIEVACVYKDNKILPQKLSVVIFIIAIPTPHILLLLLLLCNRKNG